MNDKQGTCFLANHNSRVLRDIIKQVILRLPEGDIERCNEMRQRNMLVIGMGLLVSVLMADSASAYYSPSMGRFLNRDPIHEPGHVVLKTQGRVQPTSFIPRDPIPFGIEQNLYCFLGNRTPDRVDPLGLDFTMIIDKSCEGWKIPSSSDLERACGWIDDIPENLISSGRRRCMKRRCSSNSRRGKIVCSECCRKVCGESGIYGCAVPFRRTIWVCKDDPDYCEDLDTIFHEFAHSCRAGESSAQAIAKWFKDRCGERL